MERDSLDYAGRFFLVVYNTSSTVSASYATFIVLAISFALAAVFGLLYYSIATGAASSGEYFFNNSKMLTRDRTQVLTELGINYLRNQLSRWENGFMLFRLWEK